MDALAVIAFVAALVVLFVAVPYAVYTENITRLVLSVAAALVLLAIWGYAVISIQASLEEQWAKDRTICQDSSLIWVESEKVCVNSNGWVVQVNEFQD